MDLEITLFVRVPRKAFGADSTAGKINNRKYCWQYFSNVMTWDIASWQTNEQMAHSAQLWQVLPTLTKFWHVTTDSFSHTRCPTPSSFKTHWALNFSSYLWQLSASLACRLAIVGILCTSILLCRSVIRLSGVLRILCYPSNPWAYSSCPSYEEKKGPSVSSTMKEELDTELEKSCLS